MSSHDPDKDKSLDFPDRSLGSLSLSATGEQLDDVNLDRTLLDSPAPNSLYASGDYIGVQGGPYLSSTRIFDLIPRKMENYDSFDDVPLLDDKVVSCAIESVDWLMTPSTVIPDSFSEEDRSFLDTDLLYSRCNLLNYVHRAITEEKCERTFKKSPPLKGSNIVNEAAGSGATFKVNRRNRAVVSVGAEIGEDSHDIVKYEQGNSSKHRSQFSDLEESSDEGVPQKQSKETLTEAEKRLKYMTYKRPPMQRQHGVESGGTEGVVPLQLPVISNNLKNCCIDGIGDQPISSPSGTNSNENKFIPDELSPTGPPGGSKFTEVDTSPPLYLGVKPIFAQNLPTDDPVADDVHGVIDTRTYTRQKKTHLSLGTPSRALNTTVSDQWIEDDHSPCRQLNRTIDISPVDSRPMVLCSNQLNRTIDLGLTPSRDDDVGNLNETFVSTPNSTKNRSRGVTRNLSYIIRREEESPNNNSTPKPLGAKADLNGTFVFESDAEIDSPVTRSSQNTSMEDLNFRVASQIRSLGCSTISRGKLPEGMSKAALDETRLIARTSSTDTYSVAQSSESPTSSGLSSPMDAQSYDDIQSSESSVRRSMPNLAVIRGSTITKSSMAHPLEGSGQLRKNHYISDSKLSRLGTMDRPRLSIHSASTSNSSTLSRGLRAPENFRSVDRNTSTPASLNRIPSGLGAPGRVYSAQTLGSATVTRPSNVRSSQSGIANVRSNQSGMATVRSSQSGMANVRSTSITQRFFPAPRFSSVATSMANSGLRPPRAVSSTAGSSSGIPAPNFRTQSRIPGPGQLRFSRPPVSKLPGRGGATSKPSSVNRTEDDDWRDGCY